MKLLCQAGALLSWTYFFRDVKGGKEIADPDSAEFSCRSCLTIIEIIALFLQNGQVNVGFFKLGQVSVETAVKLQSPAFLAPGFVFHLARSEPELRFGRSIRVGEQLHR